MLNLWIGNLGHLLVIVAFVFSLLNVVGYFLATLHQEKNDVLANSWKIYARWTFGIHSAAIVGIIASLFYIIYNHLYEYHYAYSHSSNDLPIYYMISCFWEGQEGSFLLWMFWDVLLGIILISTNKFWESSVMTIVGLVQFFLTSMILGVVIFGTNIGSDPFILLRDAMPDQMIFRPESKVYNPDFIPQDGSGLNALLQNYWMVIHPPTLFLGFALTLIPFAYCIAGLWKKRYKEWVRPALPWALVGGGILGLGILMGGYWAYETLNFGGYWNWDPVENAVYVPWIILIASIHTMIAFKKNSTALKAAMILNMATFILILYSTFLTRSGILGESSVHSFTDLGLSGQLLIYLLFFVLGSITLLIVRWRSIPTTQQEVSTYSREFWIFIGSAVLCLAGFQVILTTSIPVFNSIAEGMGFVSNLALPVDQVEHYTKFQFWGAVLIALLSGTGQFFWWQKMDREKLFSALTIPLIMTLLISAGVIAISGMTNFKFMILLTASIYTIVSNTIILLSLLRKQSFKLAGGAVAHIGIGMMLLGMLTSAGYSKIVSKNYLGELLFDTEANPNMPANENEDNLRLVLNEPRRILDYQITYKGSYLEAEGYPSYVEASDVRPTNDPFKVTAIKDISHLDKTYFRNGDTIRTHPENIYYRIEYRKPDGSVFSLYPRIQVNPQMGGMIASPDILHQWTRDIYTHMNYVRDPNEPLQWSKTEQLEATVGDTIFLSNQNQDYIAIFEGTKAINSDEVMRLTANENPAPLTKNDVGVLTHIKILGKNQIYKAEPVFLIRGGQVGIIPDILPELGLKIGIINIDPASGKFTFAYNTTQKDYVIMKAIAKPFINILWIGTLILMLGFGIAVYRRYTEFKKMRDKGME